MNLSLPAPTSVGSAVKRVVLHREVRIFLIHLALWMIWDIGQSYALLHWIPIDLSRPEFASIAKFKGQMATYFWVSLLWNAVYVFTVHGNYALFKRLTGRGIWWGIGLFVLWELVYLLILSLMTGAFHGYYDIPYNPTTIMNGVFVLWTYGLIFIAVRSVRQSRRQRRLLEQQKTEAELAALKAQVNPHFLFNTLNNLYGTALTGDTDRTAAGIEHLSGVMRHMVEESKRDRTPIGKEIKFLENTVELHQMRLPRLETIRVQSVMTWDGHPADIAPLLLVSFVENAFKYGISVSQPCFVDIRLTVERGQLSFRCRNSVMPNNQLDVSTGTGIANVRQRLTLIYPNRHTLTVRNEHDVFDVSLTITL